MVVVAGLGVAAVGGGYVYLISQLNAAGIDVYSTDGETFAPPTAEEINGAINVLVIGSDTRVGQGKTSYGPAGNALADVIILLHVSADRKNAVALSFPRDLMVSVPECPNPEGGEKYSARDMVQINATMNTGGPACTLLTVQKLTGVKIPYLAVIDFKGVIAMSEAVGGVTVCVAEPIKDDYTQLYLEAGEHTLIGEQALAFLRTRHGVGDGSDLSRISNQQVFLTSLVRKLKDEGALTNPFTMLKLGTAALENMKFSNSLTEIGVILGMAREVNDVDLDKITFLKLPVYSLKGTYAGRVAVIQDQAQLLFDRIAQDEPLVLEEANPGAGAVVAEESAPATEPTAGTGATASEEALPEWAQGTNASVKSCSN
jgi:LCP family protein required for cell wall assembly